MWLGCWGAIRFETASDPLRARMLLESALEAVTFPAYRALLLCHLAQHAAVLGATRLARRWLAEMPSVDVAEVASE